MKSFNKFIILGLVLISIKSLAITRVVECQNSIDNTVYLTISLRGGTATLFQCLEKPCATASQSQYIQNAILNQVDQNDQVLHYVHVSGNGPLRNTMDILFRELHTDPVDVTIDGSTGWNCH